MRQRKMFTRRRVGIPDRQVRVRPGVLLGAAVFVLTAAIAVLCARAAMGTNVIVLPAGTTNTKYKATVPDNTLIDATRWTSTAVGPSPSGTTFTAAEISGMGTGGGGNNIVWRGGVINGSIPTTWDWRTTHDSPHGGTGVRIQNNGLAEWQYLRVHNVDDGMKSREAPEYSNTASWIVRDCYFTAIRDDAVEDDRFEPGTVQDCLFDGVHTFISEQNENVGTNNPIGPAEDNTIYVKRVAVRLYPTNDTSNETNKGGGKWFKWQGRGVANHRLAVSDSVFAVGENPRGRWSNLDIPSQLTWVGTNNFILWLGAPGGYGGPKPTGVTFLEGAAASANGNSANKGPNVVLIYADDLGYGDLSAYGATAVQTPHMDRLAKEGLRFTDAHAAAATCTPSRYALLTGEYAFRKKGTDILPGDAALIIEPGRTTLASLWQKVGYTTGVVGKWHLGLGAQGGPDWNGEIAPSPNYIGFNYSFIMAATGDRVPTVHVENNRVVGLDPTDPIKVDYRKLIGDWPTGKANPELLKMRPSHGHDMTIVNGISRIGYMTGGKAALWKDEDMADVFTGKAVSFIEANKDKPFFLYFALHDPHVPRVPHPRFVGKTTMGPRGDAIVQADWCVGEILAALDRLHLANNTIVIFTSDNGPVVDDGYQDDAVTKLGNHKPAGPWRGGKYSNFEAGTRVPLLVRWPGQIKRGVSNALVSQIDFLASFAALTKQSLAAQDAPDSFDVLKALLGKARTANTGREALIEQASALSLRQGSWKYIEPGSGPKMSRDTNTELGNDPAPQLYDLAADPGETRNVASQHPTRVQAMAAEVQRIRQSGRSR